MPFNYVERPSGVFDLSACQKGVPIFISYPHFLDADPIYLEAVTGLAPNKSLHRTYIDVEPRTGSPVDFIARIQVNLWTDPSLSGHTSMKQLMMPVMWQEFSVQITPQIANMLRFSTQTAPLMAVGIMALLGLVGAVAMVCGLSTLALRWHHARINKQSGDSDDGQDPLIDNQDTTNNNSIVN